MIYGDLRSFKAIWDDLVRLSTHEYAIGQGLRLLRGESFARLLPCVNPRRRAQASRCLIQAPNVTEVLGQALALLTQLPVVAPYARKENRLLPLQTLSTQRQENKN